MPLGGRDDSRDRTPTQSPDIDASDGYTTPNPIGTPQANPNNPHPRKSNPLEDAQFGQGVNNKPPNLPPNAQGGTGDAAVRSANADRSAEGFLPPNTSNARSSADSNDGAANISGGGTIVFNKVNEFGFSEQVDTVYFPDLLIYVCGANVTPHLRGTITISLGLNDNINTASFELDNSNDKFTITPENVALDSFHAGGDPLVFNEFDESAKAKIYLYKDNREPLPSDGGKGFFTPNTPYQYSTLGRRLPLNIYGSVFHRMDPVRIWVRATGFDEWIPRFTGYVTTRPMTDDWVTNERIVSINCHDIREPMRKMRVQQNSVRFHLPGPTQTTEARALDTSVDTVNGASSTNPNVPQGADPKITDKFFSDQIRSGDSYEFAWAGLTYLQIVSSLTFGGTVPAFEKTEVRQSIPEVDNRIKELQGQKNTVDEKIGSIQNRIKSLPQADEFSSEFRQLRAELDQLRGQSDGFNNLIKQEDAKAFQKQKSGGDFITGVGRLIQGRTVRYPSEKNDKIQNQKLLDGWYKLCLYGSPIRAALPVQNGKSKIANSGINEKPAYGPLDTLTAWQFTQITDPKKGAGPRCRWDDLWAPDNQMVHFLLPQKVSGKAIEDTPITEVVLNLSVAGTRAWKTRTEMLNEFSDIVDYKWWVTGTGDLVFEFPQYDFDVHHYGPEIQKILTVDLHAKQSKLDEEGGDPPTAVQAVGSITSQPTNTKEGATHELVVKPNAMVYSNTLASRNGIKILTKDFPWIKDQKRLERLAALELHRAIAEADKSTCSFAWRPWLIPNKPLEFAPRARVSLITSITETITIFGECTTDVDLKYTRMIDAFSGTRRYVTGGAASPVFFNLTVGSTDLNKLGNKFVEDSKRNLEKLKKEIDAVMRVQDLDEASGGTFPRGYDQYNVVGSPSLNDPKAIQAFAERVAQAGAAIAGGSVIQSGVLNDGSGIRIAGAPLKTPPEKIPNSNTNIGLGSGSGNSALVLNTNSQDAGRLAAAINGSGQFSAADIFVLAQIITSTARGSQATQKERAAIGWSVCNAAGAKGSLANLKRGAVAKQGSRFNPKFVAPPDVELATQILNGEIPDPTDGAESFAKANDATNYDNPAVCNLLTKDVIPVDPGVTKTEGGDAIRDTATYVFFRRNKQKEQAAVNKGQTTQNAGKWPDALGFTRKFYEKLVDTAKNGGWEPEWMLQIYAIECGFDTRATKPRTDSSDFIDDEELLRLLDLPNGDPARAKLAFMYEGPNQMNIPNLISRGWDFKKRGRFYQAIPEVQIDYVAKYFVGMRTRFVRSSQFSSAAQMYLCNIGPTRIGKPFIYSEASDLEQGFSPTGPRRGPYRANKGQLDVNNDGTITEADLEAKIEKITQNSRYKTAVASLNAFRQNPNDPVENVNTDNQICTNTDAAGRQKIVVGALKDTPANIIQTFYKKSNT